MSSKRKTAKSHINRINEEEFVKPNGGYGWIILILAFEIGLVLNGCIASVQILEIEKYFNVSSEMGSLVTRLSVSVPYLSGPIVSGLTSQLGVRPVAMTGTIVLGLVFACCIFLPSIYYMIVLFGIIGSVAFACTYNSLFIILVQYFDKKLGMANGITIAGSDAGLLLMPLFAILNILNFNWKILMLVQSGIISLCCALAYFLRPIEYTQKKQKIIEMNIVGHEQQSSDMEELNQDADDVNLPQVDIQNKATSSEILMKIIREIVNFKLLKENKLLLMIVISNFFAFLFYETPYNFIPLPSHELASNGTHFTNQTDYLENRDAEVTINKSDLVVVLMVIFEIPFRVAFGFIADKRIFKLIDMNTVCILIAALAMSTLYFLTEFYKQAIFAISYAFAMAGLNCLTTVYLVEMVGSKSFANAFGILSMARGVGLTIGPYLADLIYNMTHTVFYPYLISVISLAISFVFTLRVSVIRRQKNNLPINNNAEPHITL